MKKINFKNLPDASTPLSAENMNLLQNNIEESTVEVSSTQPTNKQAVWFKKSKNLLSNDFNRFVIGSPYAYFQIKNDEKDNVTLSLIEKDSSVDLTGTYFGLSKSGANADGGVLWIIQDGKQTVPSITEKQNNFVSIFPANAETYNKVLQKYNVQVEYGTKATSYEPYANKEILTYNGSGYDKFDVIESGINSLGQWEKYSNGTLKQYGKYIFKEKNFERQYGSIWLPLSSVGEGQNFPIEFLDNNIKVIATADFGGAIGDFAFAEITKKNFRGFIYAVLKADWTHVDISLNWEAIGRWK